MTVKGGKVSVGFEDSNTSIERLLCVDSVSKTFRNSSGQNGAETVESLREVSFCVDEGEFVCLLGPSGSGKSTLLRIVNGLVAPTSGSVWLDGQRLIEPQRNIGFVFQQTNLMPWRTVLENVLLPLEVQGTLTDADRERACSLLATVGLDGFEHVYPKQLSGGMSQRVVLARTLVHEPRLLLMDEPFSALDSLTRERLNLELLRLHRDQCSTVLMVTHSINEAVFLADRVVVLGQRPGRVRAQIPVDLPRPRDLEVMSSEAFGRLIAWVRQSLA